MFLQRHLQRHTNERQQQPPQCEHSEHLESLSCEGEHGAESTHTRRVERRDKQHEQHCRTAVNTPSPHAEALQNCCESSTRGRTSNTYFTDLFQRRDEEVIADDCQRVEHVHGLQRRREKVESGDCHTELNGSIPTHLRFDLVQAHQENKMLSSR